MNEKFAGALIFVGDFCLLRDSVEVCHAGWYLTINIYSMMKQLLYAGLAVLLIVGCKDNDPEIGSSPSEPLQQKITQLNQELKLRQQLVSKVSTGVVVQFERSQTGVVLTFDDGTVVTLPLSNGGTPLIGTKSEEGVSYWTFTSGDKTAWLTDGVGTRFLVKEAAPLISVDKEGYWCAQREASQAAWRIVNADKEPVLAVETVNVAQIKQAEATNGAVTITFSDGDVLHFGFPTDLSTEGTANCYVVQHAGPYSFKASVRGNGKGDVASCGFDPQIEVGEGLTADWLWTTDRDLVSEVRYDATSRTIRFTASEKSGNALLVLVKGDQIVWSWHIWVVGELSAVNYANGAAFMDRNLGAMSAEAGSQEAYGCYYQWGRKDPFYGGQTTETSATAFAEAKRLTVVNEKYAAMTWVAATGEFSTAEYAAAHPMTFLYNKMSANTVYDWLIKPVKTLWSATKTLNDPCPVGYRVPTMDQWSDLESGNNYISGVSDWDGVKYGMTYTHGGVTTWYPAQGYRNQNSGSLVGLGTTRSGNYWSVEPEVATSKFFYFQKKLTSSSGSINRGLDKNRAFGYSVRCCKEK